MENSGFFLRLRARLQAGEGGFTLVELLVALTVFVIAITSLAYTATIAFSDIGLARLRQTANGLATQALEQARAIPFDTIKAGLSSNDSTVTSDSNITACGANKCYRGEQIPISAYAAGTTIKPLVPHTTTVTIGSETFTTSVYVTYYNNQPTSNELRVTAVANWASSIRDGADHSIKVQTVVYSPQA